MTDDIIDRYIPTVYYFFFTKEISRLHDHDKTDE